MRFGTKLVSIAKREFQTLRHEGWHSRLVSIVESFARWKITPQGYIRGKKDKKASKLGLQQTHKVAMVIFFTNEEAF